MRLVAAVMVIATLTAGCAPEREASENRRMVTCGGEPFPPERLDASPMSEDDPAVKAAREFVSGQGRSMLPRRVPGPIRVLTRSGDRVQFAIELGGYTVPTVPPSAEPKRDFAILEMRKSGNEWIFAGSSSGCSLRSVVDIYPSVDWALDPKAPPPGSAATSLKILVFGRACSSGKPPTDRIRRPVIDYAAGIVTITITEDLPTEGSQTCQGSPPGPFTVNLSQPLGDRRLLDGGPYPAVPVRSAEELS